MASSIKMLMYANESRREMTHTSLFIVEVKEGIFLSSHGLIDHYLVFNLQLKNSAKKVNHS